MDNEGVRTYVVNKKINKVLFSNRDIIECFKWLDENYPKNHPEREFISLMEK